MWERAVKGIQMIVPWRVMKRSLRMESKEITRNSTFPPPLLYAPETWMWNAAQQSQIQALEMSYLRGACSVSRWDGENSKCTRDLTAEVDCGVVEWVKYGTLRWLGRGEDDTVKRM